MEEENGDFDDYEDTGHGDDSVDQEGESYEGDESDEGEGGEDDGSGSDNNWDTWWATMPFPNERKEGR